MGAGSLALGGHIKGTCLHWGALSATAGGTSNEERGSISTPYLVQYAHHLESSFEWGK